MEAKCIRTGKCCQRLDCRVMIGVADQIKALKDPEQKGQGNSAKISELWREDALATQAIGRKSFPCRFLDEDNVCTLQENKPEVCSYSLSPEALSTQASPFQFFHSSCGYLKGAPEELKTKVELNTREAVDTMTSEELDKLAEEVAMDEDWIIYNGKWVKVNAT